MTRKELIDELLAEAFLPDVSNSNNMNIVASSGNNQLLQIRGGSGKQPPILRSQVRSGIRRRNSLNDDESTLTYD